MRLLDQQKYLYAQSKEQAELLLVLQWGNTIAFNRETYVNDVAHAGRALEALKDILQMKGIDQSQIDSMLGGGDPFAKGYAAVVGDLGARLAHSANAAFHCSVGVSLLVTNSRRASPLRAILPA
jgi:hypothetical protein